MGRNESSNGEESGKIAFSGSQWSHYKKCWKRWAKSWRCVCLTIERVKVSVLINCLNEEVKNQVLELEGLELTEQDGRMMAKLSVQQLRSTSITLSEIMKLVEGFVWGEYELEK